MSDGSWHWEPDTGQVDHTFGTQEEAETWLAEYYEDLLDEGINAVTLKEGDRAVYGPMPLEPA